MAALLHPRRGGRPGPRIKIDRSAGAALRERFGVLEASTPLDEQPGADAEMTEAARNCLSGDANLRGAAVVAALLAQATGSYELGKSIATPLADVGARARSYLHRACVRRAQPGLLGNIWRSPM